MKLLSRLLAGLLLSVASTSAVYASTFNFSFVGDSSVVGTPGLPFSGSGQMFATEIGATSQYLVTGISGTTMGSSISSLFNVGGFLLNDNLLTLNAGGSTASLDIFGVSYLLANGVAVNLFQVIPGIDVESLLGFPGFLVAETQTAAITITPVGSQVPEPGTLALLGTGALGVVGVVRRRLSV